MILAILQGGGIQRRKSISFFAGSHTADQLALVSFIRFVVKEALATSITANRKFPLLTEIKTRIFKASLTIIGYAIVATGHHASAQTLQRVVHPAASRTSSPGHRRGSPASC